jgi:DNA repair exonuclease SbcCD ATPase subunit
MAIIFRKVSYKNFLSTGNIPNVIFLDRVPSVIITGQNGAGKSTILDAITFAVYGKPYRNINKPQLVNSVNEKNCVVEVEFEVNTTPYRVVRGIKPNIFEIYKDGVLMSEDAANRDYQKKLEDILGMNYKAFTQIVILGSARYQSFMDLSTNDRRTIIEEILDITVFSKMNSVLKTMIQNTDLDLREIEYHGEILKAKISAQKGLIQNISSRSKESEDRVEQERIKIGSQIVLVDHEITKLDSDIAQVPQVDITELNNKMSEAKSKGKEVQKKISDLEKQIDFYSNSDVCHTCHQTISDDTKMNQLTTLNTEKRKFDNLKPVLFDTFKILTQRIEDGSKTLQKIQELTTKKQNLVNEKKTMSVLLSKLEVTTRDTDENSLQEAQEQLQTLNTELINKDRKQIELVQQKHYYDICKILLRDDGIKSKIIKQYLPVMNKLINQFLDRMGANYSFNLDEGFNEIIKSRYRDNFSYASFSEGEKQRIDLALMFTWREIAKLKNSVNTNLLMFDEIGDSSMDGEGTDILWDLISEMTDSNVFVISHKTSNIERFSSHIEFTKVGNFSHIKDTKVKEA